MTQDRAAAIDDALTNLETSDAINQVAAQSGIGLNGYVDATNVAGKPSKRTDIWGQEGARRELAGAVAFLDVLPKIERAGPESGVYSYALKHAAERWAGFYISNGAMLMAAVLRSVHTWQDADTPNAMIAVRKSECWPDSLRQITRKA